MWFSFRLGAWFHGTDCEIKTALAIRQCVNTVETRFWTAKQVVCFVLCLFRSLSHTHTHLHTELSMCTIRFAVEKPSLFPVILHKLERFANYPRAIFNSARIAQEFKTVKRLNILSVAWARTQVCIYFIDGRTFPGDGNRLRIGRLFIFITCEKPWWDWKQEKVSPISPFKKKQNKIKYT